MTFVIFAVFKFVSWLYFINISAKVSNYEWKPFTNNAELKAYAKTFGDRLYVGGGTYNTYSGPARINTDGHCTLFWKGLTRNATNCFYLKDLPEHLRWMRIGYINNVVDAVKFKFFKIGRIIFENGRIYLGRIKHGFLYYDIGNKESKTGNYEVLVFNPISSPLLNEN